MLAHSPPLPLTIDYVRKIGAEDEEGIILALKQRDRVRRVRLILHITILQKLIVTIDEKYPILEYLVIFPWLYDAQKALKFSETLQELPLRHLTLGGFSIPIGFRLLTTTVGLVTLYLRMNGPPSYSHPNTLLNWLTIMPQLETLVIFVLKFAHPNPDEEGPLTHTPILTPIALLNLRWFAFRGVDAYFEALVHRITTPRLEKLEVCLDGQPTYSNPCLQQFVNTTPNLRFDSVKFEFSPALGLVLVTLYLREEDEIFSIRIHVDGWPLGWQVSSVAQISNSLSQMFSAIEHLTLEHAANVRLSGNLNNEVDRTEWRRLLSSFSKVKTLFIDDGLVKDLSRCLESDDGELPSNLLPELQELTYSGSGDTGNPFASFINARQNADRPVTITMGGIGALKSDRLFFPITFS
jgi:hypothetical protein